MEEYGWSKAPETPKSWVLNLFLDSGFAYATVYSALDAILMNSRSVWQEQGRRVYLVEELINCVEAWMTESRIERNDR